jgi:hypothetical protein
MQAAVLARKPMTTGWAGVPVVAVALPLPTLVNSRVVQATSTFRLVIASGFGKNGLFSDWSLMS